MCTTFQWEAFLYLLLGFMWFGVVDSAFHISSTRYVSTRTQSSTLVRYNVNVKINNNYNDNGNYRIPTSSSIFQHQEDASASQDLPVTVRDNLPAANIPIEPSFLDLSTTRTLLLHFQKSTNNLESDKPLLQVSSRLSIAFVLLLTGTYAASCLLAECLVHWEWFQAWRYTWPFGIGALYLLFNVVAINDNVNVNNNVSRRPPITAGGLLPGVLPYNIVDEDDPMIQSMTGQSIMTRIIVILLALGMIIGGAYDLWMPVYMTGPNVITAAGIGQDAAVGLLMWSFWKTLVSTSNMTLVESSLRLQKGKLPQVCLLLAELYKLGEGSLDELLFSKFWW